MDGCFEKSQTSDSFTAFLEHACAKVSLLLPNPFLVACFVHTLNTERCLRVILWTNPGHYSPFPGGR